MWLQLLWLGLATSALAQFKEGGSEPNDVKTGQTQVTRWRAGMIIKASGGACRGMTGYAPVPTDWPEQEVNTVDEEKTGGAHISYETVDGGAKIMTVRVGHLASGDEAKAIVTVEIRRSTILPPKKTDIYSIPDPAKLTRPDSSLPDAQPEDREPRSENPPVGQGNRRGQGEGVGPRRGDLRLGPREGEVSRTARIKGALAALKDGTGDCEELTSLFIAICRAADIPARTVWVPGHCYPEFYLVDDKGKGRWFPCQSAGKREFGGITEMRPILQKGDNFRPPKGTKERQRYMAERVIGTPCPAAGSRRCG